MTTNSQYFSLTSALREEFQSAEKVTLKEIQRYVGERFEFSVSVRTLKRSASDAGIALDQTSTHTPISVLFDRIAELDTRIDLEVAELGIQLDYIQKKQSIITDWATREWGMCMDPKPVPELEKRVGIARGNSELADSMGFIGDRKWKTRQICDLVKNGMPRLEEPKLSKTGKVIEMSMYDISACREWLERNKPNFPRIQSSDNGKRTGRQAVSARTPSDTPA